MVMARAMNNKRGVPALAGPSPWLSCRRQVGLRHFGRDFTASTDMLGVEQPRMHGRIGQQFLVLFGLVWCCLALFGPNFFMFFRGAVEPAWETSELSRRPEARAFHGKNLETPCVVSYGLRVNWKKYSGVLLEKCDGIPRGTALLLGAQEC